MAANNDPIHVLTPKIGRGALAAANTARDGSGTVVSILTVGSNGGLLFRIVARQSQATAAASTAKVACIWISIDAGTTWDLLDEAAFAAVTASATAVGQVAIFEFPGGKLLPPAAQIGATITVYAGVQDRTIYRAEHADY